MSEAPRQRIDAHEGSTLEVAPEAIRAANEFIDSRPDLQKRIAESADMAAVRNAVIESLGLSLDKAVMLLSDENKAVLSEALGRWNKARLEKSQ